MTNERKEQILSDGRFTGCPEIVIEILSPGSMNERRDRQFKRKLYSSRGAHEYWIVDPETRSVEVYRKRKQGGLGSSVQLQTGDEISTSLLPGFTLPVEAVFAK
jgi:Uma2 family endonuclease